MTWTRRGGRVKVTKLARSIRCPPSGHQVALVNWRFVGEQVQCTYRRLPFLPTDSSVSSWMEVAGASYNTGKGGILSLESCTARVTHILYLRSGRMMETWEYLCSAVLYKWNRNGCYKDKRQIFNWITRFYKFGR